MNPSDLTRGQLDTLVAMLGTAWAADGPTLRSLVALGLVERAGGGHRLTADGKRIAYARLAETRQPGVA